MQRILDELQQDVTFLSYAILFDDYTDLHKRYLEAFYLEEFENPSDIANSAQKRPSIPRRKIRGYIAAKEKEMGMVDSYRSINTSYTLHKAYSGYLHAASPQIMNIYGGYPPKFHINGMLNTPHETEYRDDLWNYFYRGLLSFHELACVFDNKALETEINEYITDFAKSAGKKYT